MKNLQEIKKELNTLYMDANENWKAKQTEIFNWLEKSQRTIKAEASEYWLEIKDNLATIEKHMVTIKAGLSANVEDHLDELSEAIEIVKAKLERAKTKSENNVEEWQEKFYSEFETMELKVLLVKSEFMDLTEEAKKNLNELKQNFSDKLDSVKENADTYKDALTSFVTDVKQAWKKVEKTV